MQATKTPILEANDTFSSATLHRVGDWLVRHDMGAHRSQWSIAVKYEGPIDEIDLSWHTGDYDAPLGLLLAEFDAAVAESYRAAWEKDHDPEDTPETDPERFARQRALDRIAGRAEVHLAEGLVPISWSEVTARHLTDWNEPLRIDLYEELAQHGSCMPRSKRKV
jgi:hypothetical protein